MGADLVIKDTEFELDAGRIRRVDEHALQGRDGTFIVARIAGGLRILEGEIEIAGIGDHPLQHGVALWLRGLSRRRRLGSPQDETNRRDRRRRQFRPRTHKTSVRRVSLVRCQSDPTATPAHQTGR